MANPTEASVAAAAPSVPGHGPPPGGVIGPLPGNPVVGTSEDVAGVFGQSNLGPGVLGQSVAYAALPNSGQSDGVLGEGGKNGVHGVSVAATGAGVLGEHKGGGQGVLGSSVSGVGVEARSQSGTALSAFSTSGGGILAGSDKGIAVQAISTSGTGVQGSSGPILGGGPVTGDGVVGIGKNGVHGQSASPTDSGVWGENKGGGFGVAGSTNSSLGGPAAVDGNNQGGGPGVRGISKSGIGVWGEGGSLAGNFEGDLRVHGHIFSEGDVDSTGHLKVSGNISTAGDITLTNADCAEDFDVSGDRKAAPGTVMAICDDGSLTPCSQAYDRRVAGVVSGAGGLRPGIILGRHAVARSPIALVGTVYCHADASYSPIQVGDLLTTSTTPGHAMRASDPGRSFGAVIGKALRSLAAGRGLIPVLVGLQ
jgi:hypothetical protein